MNQPITPEFWEEARSHIFTLCLRIEALQQQRDAAVAVLRSSENQSPEFKTVLLTNAEAHAIAACLYGCISDALSALGAEEAK